MSWETVPDLPSDAPVDGGQGPFRAGAEPVVARRGPPGLLERIRLWWLSTPDLPSGRAPHELVVTPEYVYVRFADGKMQRAPRSEVRGRREDRGRIIYRVADGADLALLPRARCPVMGVLDTEVVHGSGAPLVYVDRDLPEWWKAVAAILGVGAFILGFVQGSTISPALEILAFAIIMIAVFVIPRSSRRVVIDSVGVHVRSGPAGIFRESHSPEAFEAIRVHFVGRRGHPAVRIDLVRTKPKGYGDALVVKELDARHTSRDYALAQGRRVAEVVRDRIGLEVRVPETS